MKYVFSWVLVLSAFAGGAVFTDERVYLECDCTANMGLMQNTQAEEQEKECLNKTQVQRAKGAGFYLGSCNRQGVCICFSIFPVFGLGANAVSAKKNAELTCSALSTRDKKKYSLTDECREREDPDLF